ncbi:MAG: DEAD/DEAH box helicase [Solirubrobacteraceae bacterium MAG38_C4-C5]|nr:DEAD/DEAH box helicase [Candidatus Siliceabacter maunaloa]
MPGPAIVQSDRTVLLEVAHPGFEEARGALASFAELEKSPEHVHTYRISPVSLWNAAAAGHTAEAIASTLVELSRYEVPQAVLADVRDLCGRYGRLRLLEGDGGLLRLVADEPALLAEVTRADSVAELLRGRPSPGEATLAGPARGPLKQALIGLGWPVEDLAPYEDGDALELSLADDVDLRPYQADATAAFAAAGAGVIVLPCGAGKTVVGLAAIAQQGTETLIVTSNAASVTQWRRELCDKTTVAPEAIGEYSGRRKEIRPVTVTTYQMLTHRPRRDGGFPHLDLFERREWGLVIYDEVHLLPAPVFRATARIQARRRLGLTATLIREDGAEPLVFSLVGPKRYDTAWRELEQAGWIAGAECAEVRVPLGASLKMEHAVAQERERFRLASANPAKDGVVSTVLERHPGAQTLVIGYYVDQLRRIAQRLGAPVITGRTPGHEREALYDAFRAGEVPVLCVSKVANFALDLPSASVAVQVSGTFGSRQEEAQRLGRLLRPKPGDNRAWFYTLVSHETSEQEFAHKRQLFLAEQGYRYTVLDPDELAAAPIRRAAA